MSARAALLGLLLPVHADVVATERLFAEVQATFLDPSFPFLEATLDCRGIAPLGTSENLVPRGIILPLGEQIFVCFDTELLRVAAIWQGDFVTPHGMAMYSYNQPLREIPGGQKILPKPQGRIWAATGLYPGWSEARDPVLDDPRHRWVDKEELGRGPLPEQLGRWEGISDAGSAAVLHYRVHGTNVREYFSLRRDHNGTSVVRTVEVRGMQTPLLLTVNDYGTQSPNSGSPGSSPESSASPLGRVSHVIPMDRGQQVFEILYLPPDQRNGTAVTYVSHFQPPKKMASRWPLLADAPVVAGTVQGSYAVDQIRLPDPNPWKRRIRPIDMIFRDDGTAFVLTFDGDIYTVSGLSSSEKTAVWRRTAAGFNEAQSIQIRDGKLFVFSRLGVTRLDDVNADGEIDEYRMFCNDFTQSAETRDYPLSLLLLPDQSFLISKGGQQIDRRSPHSGRVLHISPDGQSVKVFASGLRNGYLGIDPKSGLITASDQQGNWVPTSPVLRLREGAYYGHEPSGDSATAEPDSPLVWLPHRIAQSTVGQVYGLDARAGPLAGGGLVIDYFKPGIVKILLPDSGEPVQGAAVAVPVVFPIPAVKGNVNPADGLPYFAGFKIEGSMARDIEGICRLRPVAPMDGLPIRAEVFRHGVVLQFREELDPEVLKKQDSFEVSTWEYKRTSNYGSGQFRATGEPGIDRLSVRGVWPGSDGRSVLLAIEGLQPTMQLEVKHRLFGSWSSVYFTINQLTDFGVLDQEFAALDLENRFVRDAHPARPLPSEPQRDLSIEDGRGLFANLGCLGCHSIDGSTDGKPAPTLAKLFGQMRKLHDGRAVEVDDAYLKRSILAPGDEIAQGYAGGEIAMPSYEGILDERSLDALVLYLRSL